MTKRLPAIPAPGPLEEYAARFDGLFATLAQRQAFRRYLEGLLLPAERNNTLTAETSPKTLQRPRAARTGRTESLVRCGLARGTRESSLPALLTALLVAASFAPRRRRRPRANPSTPRRKV